MYSYTFRWYDILQCGIFETVFRMINRKINYGKIFVYLKLRAKS